MTGAADHPIELPGLTVSFHPDEGERTEQAVEALKRLGFRRLRVPLAPDAAGIEADEAEWVGTLLSRLAVGFEVLPCLSADAPEALVDAVSRQSGLLGEIEIAAAPGKAAQALQLAAHFKGLGFLTVVSGIDLTALDLVAPGKGLDAVDVLGIESHQGTGATQKPGWSDAIAAYAQALEVHGARIRLWITESSFSTWRHDERGQIRAFLGAADAPAERVYWSSLQDLDPSEQGAHGFHADERDYFHGILRADGSPKLLGRLLEKGGIAAVRSLYRLGRPIPVTPARTDKPVVVTGGAGFIGTNLADRLVREGNRVIVYDNLSRPGVEQNIEWLKATHGNAVTFELADIRDPYVLRDAVSHAGRMFHFAAQVAVTTSLVDPVADFEINARGTVNLLEAIRAHPEPPPLVFTSTNKVYGKLADVALELDGKRYAPTDAAIDARGIDESRPLDFYSPYGASKGSADQYVLDYCRTYDLPTAVFRMSCIYGPHQFGTEDQGWVAHFLIRALQDEAITLYGDGYQVRDILFVEDLVDAFMLAQANMPAIRGQAFNIGGGPANATSLVELLDRIGEAAGCRPEIAYGPWRPGDQLYYVSDTSKFGEATGWKPRTGIAKGIGLLADWLAENRVVAPSSLSKYKDRRAAS
ncbi:NAD-dependent dehydratase [Skermanella aerolata]|uniref:NAD-dependent dehydratase n=1 Tax=Skermanella aerolata TaxID=393310 RepID=A0A512DSB2_9PROT|nr:SDR family NAD(P)-dependent oxidoreductase [Skermanella aerolata]GEO39378.1 NAD-dependent dehydratase [Skermanella aerolata]